MRAIDLSQVINPDTTVYPGTEKPIFERKTIDGYPEVKITMYTHTATHMDAPCHIIKNAKTLDDFTVDKFIGKAIVIDCKKLAKQQITLDFLKPYEDKIKNVEFVLFNAGWSAKWQKEEYFEDFPVLSNEAAKWLTGFKLKGIGLDSISLDKVYDVELINHHIVLEKEILIIENMTNMDSLPAGEFILHCLPLKIEKADGSPVRAVALVD